MSGIRGRGYTWSFSDLMCWGLGGGDTQRGLPLLRGEGGMEGGSAWGVLEGEEGLILGYKVNNNFLKKNTTSILCSKKGSDVLSVCALLVLSLNWYWGTKYLTVKSMKVNCHYSQSFDTTKSLSPKLTSTQQLTEEVKTFILNGAGQIYKLCFQEWGYSSV